MQPKVSIVVPIYNVEKYVEQCVRSLMGQTLREIEIILVNDGSKDGSREIIGRLAQEDPRISILDRENSGYGASINAGFAAATGEYLGILESDDYCEPDAFETLYALAKSAGADMAKCAFNFYWSDPERWEYFGIVDAAHAERPMAPLDYESMFYVKASIWSAIYRADFIRAQGITLRESPGASYQDTSFSFKVMCLAKTVAYTQEALFNYRQDNENSSVNSKGKAFVLMDEYAEIERFLAQDSVENAEELSKIAAMMKYDAYIWNYNRVDASFHLELAERMSEEFKRDTARGAIDIMRFSTEKWYPLMLIMKDPARFVRLWDEHKETPLAMIGRKAYNFYAIVRKDGIGTYIRNLMGKIAKR